MIYLPKEKVVIQQAIEPVDSTCLPSEVVHHYINASDHFFIMNQCVCREADHCDNYPINIGCLFLGRPVLDINPKFGRIVTKDEAHNHEKKAREAGLIHLIGRYKIDSIWLGTGPAEELITICNCCPCCCFATAIPNLEPDVDIRVIKMPGVDVHVTNACIGCGKCLDSVCFVKAIHLNNGKASISASCRGCGRCVEECPLGAIEMTYAKSAVVDTLAEINYLVHLKSDNT
jgi:ferredoxin